MAKILQGKLEERLPEVCNESIHYIFIDPPYNIGYSYKTYKDKMMDDEYYEWTDKWIRLGFEKLVHGGVMQIMTHNKHLNMTITIGKNYGRLYEVVFWKSTKQPHNCKTFQNFSQPIITFIKGDSPRVDKGGYFSPSVSFLNNTSKIERILYQNKSRIDNSMILDNVTNSLLFDIPVKSEDITLCKHFINQNLKMLDNWDTFVLNSSDTFSDVGIIQHMMNEFFVRYSFIEYKKNELFAWYNNQKGHFSDVDRVYSGSFCKKEAVREGTSKKVHSCQMPLQLVVRGIKRFTLPTDKVLDFFVGSGTTVVAAEFLGREGIGIEVDIDYCAMAKKRIANQTEEMRTLLYPEIKIKPFKGIIPDITMTPEVLSDSIYFKEDNLDSDYQHSYQYQHLYTLDNTLNGVNLYTDAPENVNIFLLSKDSDYGDLRKHDLVPIRFGVFYNKEKIYHFVHCYKGSEKKRTWHNVYFPRLINWLHKRETLKAEGVRPSEVVFLPTYNAYKSSNIRDDWKMRLRAHYVALMRYYENNSNAINKEVVYKLNRKIYEPLIKQGSLLRSVNLFLGHVTGDL